MHFCKNFLAPPAPTLILGLGLTAFDQGAAQYLLHRKVGEGSHTPTRHGCPPPRHRSRGLMGPLTDLLMASPIRATTPASPTHTATRVPTTRSAPSILPQHQVHHAKHTNHTVPTTTTTPFVSHPLHVWLIARPTRSQIRGTSPSDARHCTIALEWTLNPLAASGPLPAVLLHAFESSSKNGIGWHAASPGNDASLWPPATANAGETEHSTARHGTARQGTRQYSTAQRSAAQHSTVQRSTAQLSTAQYSTPHRTMSTPQLYPWAVCRVRSPARQGPGTTLWEVYSQCGVCARPSAKRQPQGSHGP